MASITFVICLGLSLSAQQVEEVIKVNVSLVTINVLVTDTKGHPYPGLQAVDFHVTEEGKPMRVEFFDHEGAASIVFVIDLSSSMRGEKWECLKAAMRKFLRNAGSGSNYSLIGFNEQPRIMARSIHSQQLLEIINTTTPDGSTALYDGVLLGFNVLGQVTQRHKALVLFSDGEDHSSRATIEEVRKQALTRTTSIYTIGITNEESPFRRNGLTGKELLKDLALATGGSVHFPGPDGIKRVLEEISVDLKGRYSLSYYPTNKTTGWHTIKVSLTPRKQEVKLRYQQRYLVN